ncbi:MAG TPA: hypothetical protein VM033_06335 [Gemmatimonadaceae bacterium]|nr:hypothetical protein [Gemmatimonadaceae bacterium]
MTGEMDWLAEGRELGLTLDHCHAIVVVGADPEATALVALGIGRAQAARRRVAVGDLIGDAPPLHSLVPGEDVHGLVDSFMYGVSLNRVAYPVAGERELFVMPSGTSPIDYDELFLNPRWRRLATGFREVGALLILAAPAHAPHLRDLVDAADGAVLVGDEVPSTLSVAQSLAWIRPRKAAPISVSNAVPPAQSPPMGVLSVPELARTTPWPAWAAGILLAIALVGAGVWFWQRPFASDRPPRRGVAGTSDVAAAATGGQLATDSAMRAREALREAAVRDSAARAANLAVAVDSFPVLAAANAADSAMASAYAVLLENTNGLAGAILQLNDKFATLPATSYGLSLRSRLFELVSGAFSTRAGAESLLVDLRARKVLAPGVGTITTLPYAFLVQRGVAAAEVPARLKRASARAQPVYALRQPDGSANLYFGAYESPQQAALAVPAVRKAGLTPTLVYRIGRVY